MTQMMTRGICYYNPRCASERSFMMIDTDQLMVETAIS